MLIVALLMFMAAFWLIFSVILEIAWPVSAVVAEQVGFYERAWDAAHEGRDASDEHTGAREIAKRALDGIMTRRRLMVVIAALLTEAGLQTDPREFVLLHTAAVIACGLFGSLIGGVTMAVVMVAGATISAPLYLLLLRSKRASAIETDLPEALSMIVASLRAGYGLSQAIDAVAEEMRPPVGAELAKVAAETRLGKPLEQAMEKMAERVGRPGVEWLVMIIKVQREVGGNLAEVLETLAQTLRARARIARQVKVLTAEGRLSATILYALPFFVAALIYFVNPVYVGALVQSLAGFAMLSTAMVLMIVGAVWLAKIVDIKV